MDKKSKDEQSEKSDSSVKLGPDGVWDPLSQLKTEDERKAFAKVRSAFPSLPMASR